MLTRRQTGIALRCSACGATNILPVFLFSLKSSRRDFHCSCGYHILSASRKGTDVWLQLSCFLCDGVHLFKFGDRAFWSRDIKSILCPETNAEIGYVGPVWGLLKVEDIREDGLPGAAAIFEDPEMGLRVLTRLLALDDRGRLRCSRCDSRLEVEVYPGGMELWCGRCGVTLFAPVGAKGASAGGQAGPERDGVFGEGAPAIELASAPLDRAGLTTTRGVRPGAGRRARNAGTEPLEEE